MCVCVVGVSVGVGVGVGVYINIYIINIIWWGPLSRDGGGMEVGEDSLYVRDGVGWRWGRTHST